MSYLDYARPSDMSEWASLRHDVMYKRTDVLREMSHARTWKARTVSPFQQHAIERHVQRAREANRELVALLRQQRDMEVEA